jgi:hypothetical protein
LQRTERNLLERTQALETLLHDGQSTGLEELKAAFRTQLQEQQIQIQKQNEILAQLQALVTGQKTEHALLHQRLTAVTDGQDRTHRMLTVNEATTAGNGGMGKGMTVFLFCLIISIGVYLAFHLHWLPAERFRRYMFPPV